MSVTLDRFKKAFGGGVGDDLLAQRRGKVHQALKEFKSAVDTLEALGAAAGHKAEFLKLVVWFNKVNKQGGGNADLYAELDEIKDEVRAKAALAKAAALADPKA